MSRVRRLLTTIVPSMLAGGLLFGTAFGHAAAGRDDMIGFWPASSDRAGAASVRRAPAPRTAQAPLPPRHRAPPLPPAPPAPPAPPHRGHSGKHGDVSVSIKNGAINIEGIDDMVRAQLDGVREMLRTNPSIPKHVRDKALARVDRVRSIVDRRLANLKGTDLDKLGDEMERMGEEIETAMEGLEEDLEKLGDQMGKEFAKQLGKQKFGPGAFKLKFDFDHDDDDDDDHDTDLDTIPMTPDLDGDDGDLRDAIGDLQDLALQPGQRDQITRLRSDSDRNVATAKRQLDDLSKRLETALEDPRTSDSDIGRYVDQISAQEAAIRKARILAWVNARRVLDESQRKKIEDAARKKAR